MKLYYAPHACSISPHIALRESGLPFELSRVDFKTRKTDDGKEFAAVNPKGYVPALLLDNGQVLTEGAVMVQYIADLAPASGLAPPNGTFERVRLQEWLNFIATELHKGAGPLFSPTAPADYKAAATERLGGRLAYIAKTLEKQHYLLGDRYTVADGYLYYIMRVWKRFHDGAVPPGFTEYHARLV